MKESIRALSVGFLYDTATDSYAVEGSVEHKLVEDQPAFFGFTVKRVVKQ
jgi:hypothetical protein